MPSPRRSPLPLIALAVVISLLFAVPPLSAQTVARDSSPLVVPTKALPPGFAGYDKSSGADPFFLIKKTLVMSEIDLELPVPDYAQVDVLGTIKNAPGSIACGGAVSEGAAADADLCRLQHTLQLQNGYLKTNGTVITPNATAYNGVPAGIEIVGHVGDIVQLTVKNELPESVNGEAIETGFYAPADNRQVVHWHGMELDNESDGTPVSEFGIETGEQRLYQYRLYRPGNYWFHPHVMPLLSEHRGMLGRLIIRSYEEDLLTLLGVLPLQKHLFQLHDSVVANEINRFQWRTNVQFNVWTDEEVNNHLMPNIEADLNSDGECDRGVLVGDCNVREGELVFVNGKVPTSDENIETIYVPQGRGVRVAFVNSSNERFYRFRLLLEGEEPPFGPALQRGGANTGQCYAPGSAVKFSGVDPLSCDQGLPLYRIGGQNGLLDNVRLEGQAELPPASPFAPRAFDTIIRRGEDFIGVSERTEFVVVTKDREGNYLEPGESMYIWTIDYPHGAFAAKFDNLIGTGDVSNRDIAARKLVRIKIVPDLLGLPDYNLAEGAPLMAHPSINRPSEDLRTATVVPFSAVPPGLDPFLGTPFQGREVDQAVVLSNRIEDNRRFPSINANKGDYEGEFASGDEVPTQASTRYARIGDVVEFIVANNTGAGHHPFHAHGFSFQPIALYRFNNVNVAPGPPGAPAVVDSATLIEPPVYTYDYNEFLDVEGIQPGLALKYRVKITDRFKIPDATEYSWLQLLAKFPYDYQQPFGGAGDMPQLTDAEMGGGLGRWLMHCHILHHAGLGMMTDFCIAPQGATDASACKIDVDENIYKPIP
ncbi:MAG TPA: multicopper oxidase domain-containing protein [Thermoanaerobaculia bacterium]